MNESKTSKSHAERLREIADAMEEVRYVKVGDRQYASKAISNEHSFAIRALAAEVERMEDTLRWRSVEDDDVLAKKPISEDVFWAENPSRRPTYAPAGIVWTTQAGLWMPIPSLPKEASDE